MLAAPAAAAGPLRSGTIVTGVQNMAPHRGLGVDGYLDGCRSAPDCRTWLASRCNSRLVGRPVAVTSSIANVRDLADGTTSRRIGMTTQYVDGVPTGIHWGRVSIQFRSRDCVQVSYARWFTSNCGTPWTTCSPTLRVPTGAKWMTVTSSQDNIRLRWTLT